MPTRFVRPAFPTLYVAHILLQASVTLEEIDNADDFVGKLEKIEPPGQMVSFLIDPLLQKYVALNPSPLIAKRIELWLATCLEEEYNAVKSGQDASASLAELLEGLYQHVQYSKVREPRSHGSPADSTRLYTPWSPHSFKYISLFGTVAPQWTLFSAYCPIYPSRTSKV